MRLRLTPLAIAFVAASPVAALAADAPRDKGYARSQHGATVSSRSRPVGVAVDKLAEDRLTVYDRDGVELTNSFVDPAPPRRIERRIYAREGVKPRYSLYGGFFGLDRWGVGRNDQ